MSRGNNNNKIYVGNLPLGVRPKDLEDIFFKYGSIVDVDLHANGKSTPFAFIEFDDPRDADDAVAGRDGYQLDGSRIRVEVPKSRDRGHRGGNNYGGGRGYGGGGGGGRSDFKSSKPRGYQLLVTGLPPTGSWQDLKDHFRSMGDIIFADVYKDGTGSVEFSRQDHQRRAIKEMDDTKFRSHEGETSYIRVKEPRQKSYSPYRSRSRSPAPRRSYRSKSRSRSRSYSR